MAMSDNETIQGLAGMQPETRVSTYAAFSPQKIEKEATSPQLALFGKKSKKTIGPQRDHFTAHLRPEPL